MLKKLLSLVLATIMVVGMGATALAADAQAVRDNDVTSLEAVAKSAIKSGNFYGASGGASTRVTFKVNSGENKANVAITVPSTQEYSIELFADLKSLGSHTVSGNSSWNITNIDHTTSCSIRIWPKGSGATYYYKITGSK